MGVDDLVILTVPSLYDEINDKGHWFHALLNEGMLYEKIGNKQSDQSGDEEDEGNECGDVGFCEHGADDGALFVGSGEFSGCL